MTQQEFALAYLKAVEKKHKDYFEHSNQSITDCVAIKGKSLITVHVIDDNLPFDIKHEIESMFWNT